MKVNPLKVEYPFPTHIGIWLRNGKYTVKVLETKDNWFGVTYKEDKESVVQSFKKLIADGVYKEDARCKGMTAIYSILLTDLLDF